MENNLENAVDLGTEVLENVPTKNSTIVGTVAIATVVAACIVGGIVIFKKRRDAKKSIIDGENLGMMNEEEE